MILVTGASGYIGGAVLRLLAAMMPAGELVGLARNEAKARSRLPAGVGLRIADYTDPASLTAACRDVSQVLIIASDGAGPAVMQHHANMIAAASGGGTGRGGARHIVFTSIVDVDDMSPFYFTPVYRAAEAQVTSCGVPWTILRCGLYADFVETSWLTPALASGVIKLPAGAAQVAPVTRDDIAAAAAVVLTTEGHDGRRYALTGGASLDFTEIAAIASDVLGNPLRYADCPVADYLQQAWAVMSDPWPHAYASLLASITQGRYATVSADLPHLIGRPAESFAGFLRRRVAAG